MTAPLVSANTHYLSTTVQTPHSLGIPALPFRACLQRTMGLSAQLPRPSKHNRNRRSTNPTRTGGKSGHQLTNATSTSQLDGKGEQKGAQENLVNPNLLHNILLQATGLIAQLPRRNRNLNIPNPNAIRPKYDLVRGPGLPTV